MFLRDLWRNPCPDTACTESPLQALRRGAAQHLSIEWGPMSPTHHRRAPHSSGMAYVALQRRCGWTKESGCSLLSVCRHRCRLPVVKRQNELSARTQPLARAALHWRPRCETHGALHWARKEKQYGGEESVRQPSGVDVESEEACHAQDRSDRAGAGHALLRSTSDISFGVADCPDPEQMKQGVLPACCGAGGRPECQMRNAGADCVQAGAS